MKDGLLKIVGEYERELKTDEETPLGALVPYEIFEDLRDGKLVAIDDFGCPVGDVYIPSNGVTVRIMKKEDYENSFTEEEKAKMKAYDEERYKTPSLVLNKFGELFTPEMYDQIEKRGINTWNLTKEKIEKLLKD